MATLRGGEKLQEYIDRLATSVARDPKVDVGFLEGALYPDGTSVALVAAVNEFGAPSRGQPPRPYFRRMIAARIRRASIIAKDSPMHLRAPSANGKYAPFGRLASSSAENRSGSNPSGFLQKRGSWCVKYGLTKTQLPRGIR